LCKERRAVQVKQRWQESKFIQEEIKYRTDCREIARPKRKKNLLN
jgi:hypothetical protein